MVEIIPSINVPTFEEVIARVKKVEPFVSWCHLDVTDGIFSQHSTWHNPADLPRLETKLNVEVHLMIAEPEKVIDQWIVAPVKRVIVHWEVARDLDFIIKKCRDAGVEIGLAINPETSWEKLEPWWNKVDPVRSKISEMSADSLLVNRTSNGVDMVQFLGVTPGPSGQKMDEKIPEKVRSMRSACPQCIIEVDGGINADTAKKVKEAGANILVAGNFILANDDIARAIEILR